MKLYWIAVEGMQDSKPDEIDNTSSPFCVYLRKNIKKIEKSDNDNKISAWSYDEACLTLEEFGKYQKELEECESLSQIELMESNLTVMGAVADSFEQQLILQENQLIIMEAMAELFENMVLV